MIYLIDNIQDYSDNQYLLHLKALPEWRREKALHYKRIDDRKRCVLAFRLLEYVLQNEYGITTLPEFVYKEYGKPYLLNMPIYFNLSHCKDAIACVVSNHEVGIDVESITPYNDSIVRRICNDEDYQRLDNSDNKDIEFTKLWTEKEAISKFYGKGISIELSTISHQKHLLIQQVEESYILTCCYGVINENHPPHSLVKVTSEIYK